MTVWTGEIIKRLFESKKKKEERNITAMECLLNKYIHLPVGKAIDVLANSGKGDCVLKDIQINYHVLTTEFTKTIENENRFANVHVNPNVVLTTFCTDINETEIEDSYACCSNFDVLLVVYVIEKLIKYLIYHLGSTKTNFKCLKIIFDKKKTNPTTIATTEKMNNNLCEIVLHLNKMNYLEECLGAFAHEFSHFLVFCQGNDIEEHGNLFYAVALATATITSYHSKSIYDDLDYEPKYGICVNTEGPPVVEDTGPTYHVLEEHDIEEHSDDVFRKEPGVYDDDLAEPVYHEIVVSTLEEWLTTLGLSCYINVFHDNGWENLMVLGEMTEADLDRMEINNRSHRSLILSCIEDFKSC